MQGWNGTVSASYSKYFKDDSPEYLRLSSNINYGESDDRLRAIGNISYRFDKKNRARIALSGGSKVEQFNPNLSS